MSNDLENIAKKGDVMSKLGAEMEQMAIEKQKMMDPNHKNDDTDSEEDSSDAEGHQANEYTFISAIDVGSHFIDVMPEEELLFQPIDGGLFTTFNITNPCKSVAIAYFVYTSANIGVEISPNYGFIPATFQQKVTIGWKTEHHPDKEKLENSMFFVKALPLSPDMKTEELELPGVREKVFNTYNVNILFCTHHLPCRVNQSNFNPQQMNQMQQKNQ